MEEKRDFYLIVEDICDKDKRYKPDAYEFLMQALHFAQTKLNRKGHITGGELLKYIREYVIERYGPMSKTVLNHWGLNKTQDFGNIVFNLVDKKMLSKTEADSIEDFKDVYDFGEVFDNVLRDSVIKIE